MVIKNVPFEEGQLVTFSPLTKDLQIYPYQTCGYDGGGVYVLYEKIDMHSYPSWNDFFGKSVKVRSGETGILLKVLGVPFGVELFSFKRPSLDMRVYSVLLCGQEVQVFGLDLV